jgi:hypothetical protein
MRLVLGRGSCVGRVDFSATCEARTLFVLTFLVNFPVYRLQCYMFLYDIWYCQCLTGN